MNFLGTVKYIKVSGGFWGIVTLDGKELRPVAFPEELKEEGTVVKGKVAEVDEFASMYMWGTPVELLSYSVSGR